MVHLARGAKPLGAYVRSVRVQRGLIRQASADLVGTGWKMISRIENGHAGARLDRLFSVLAALDCDMQIGPRGKGGKDVGEIF